jgi:hypothetical protein
VSPNAAQTEHYTLGWFRAAYRGQVFLEHGGGIIGFPAFMAFLPERGFAVVVLSNGSRGSRERLPMPYKMGLHKAITFSVFDHLLRAPARDWSGEFLSGARELEREMAAREAGLGRARLVDCPASLPLEQFAGLYTHAGEHAGHIHVSVANERLMLSFEGAGAYSAFLEHWHRDLFRLRSAPGVADVLGPQFASFTLGPLGRVATMMVLDTQWNRT